jgi:hypothetical protein
LDSVAYRRLGVRTIEGEQEGEQGLARGVPPHPMPACFLGGWFRVGRAIFSRELKSLPALGLRPRCPGGDLCRPLSLTCRPPRTSGQPWRERPPEMAAWPAKPAGHERGRSRDAERVLASRVSAVGPLKAAESPTRDLSKNLVNFSAVFSTVVAASRLEWLTPRGEPRQRAVVGAVRQRQVVSRNRCSTNRRPRSLVSQVSAHRRLGS